MKKKIEWRRLSFVWIAMSINLPNQATTNFALSLLVVLAFFGVSGCALPTYGTEVGETDLSLTAGDADISRADADAASNDGAVVVDAAPSVNVLPGNAYYTASCRSSADCTNDSEWVEAGLQTAIACIAPEDGKGGALTGAAQCWPIANDDVGVVLCLSALDCGGYACVKKTCAVAISQSAPDGAVVQAIGAPFVVSYCDGLGQAPTGCE